MHGSDSLPGMKVGVVGASGYTGAELVRLCSGHPSLEVAWATGDSQAGSGVGELYPSLAAAHAKMTFEHFQPWMVAAVDLVFLAMPHGRSQVVVKDIWDLHVPIVDLSADFRLRDPVAHERWYGTVHQAPELLGNFVYGLPERHRVDIVKARAVAAAGCYPTAATLALAPLVDAGMIQTEGVIVDAASGVSGAGRGAKAATSFSTANEDFVAYGLLDHRHTPEMEQAIGAQLLFTPHLAPMTRGILATCYARPSGATSTQALMDLLSSVYSDEPFVVVGHRPPSTKATWGSNAMHLTARFDERTGWVVVLAALDNLGKGAAGQAVQCANLMLGLEETAGLSALGVYP